MRQRSHRMMISLLLCMLWDCWKQGALTKCLLCAIHQGKLGSATWSKERKLTRPLSTRQYFRGIAPKLFSTVSNSTLEGGLFLHQIEKQCQCLSFTTLVWYKHGSTEYMRATCYVINFIHMLLPKVILTLFLSFTFITVYMHFTNLHTLSLLHAQNQLFSYLQDKSW